MRAWWLVAAVQEDAGNIATSDVAVQGFHDEAVQSQAAGNPVIRHQMGTQSDRTPSGSTTKKKKAKRAGWRQPTPGAPARTTRTR